MTTAPTKPAPSPPSYDELADENRFLRHQLKEALDDKSHFEELVRLLRHKQFGRSSEIHPAGQGTLFNEAEVVSASAPTEKDEGGKKKRRRGRPVRKPLPPHLPRVERLIDIPEDEKVCALSGTRLVRIGEEVSEQLDVEPAKVTVIRTVRPKYACPCPLCRSRGEGPQAAGEARVPFVRVAPAELQPLPKTMAAPGLLAYIVTAKYADALPLYRQEAIFKRSGIDLKRSTMSSWVIGLGALVRPLLNLAQEKLLEQPVIQGDETRIQILTGTGKAATSDSYMWCFVNGCRDGPRIILYELGPTRSHAVPLRFLEDYRGYLQSDGYEAYQTFANKRPHVTLVGDWAHVRRKFDEAIKALPADFKGEVKAQVGLDMVSDLFRIEREVIGDQAANVERQRLRQELSRPLVDRIKAWADETSAAVPPKTLTGIALGYLLGQWPKLTHFLDDPILRLDTNPVENAIRPFVVGRNNWMFSSVVAGAEASAALYSLVCTARANGRNPFEYLKAVFTELPKATTADQIEALLPWLWQAAGK